MSEILTDIKIDVETGYPVIDPETNDAEIISGHEVVLQDIYILLRTQRGQVRRQGIDGFGWDYYSKIKTDLSISQIQDISKEIEKVVAEDARIKRVRCLPDSFANDSISFVITIEIESGIYSFTYIL